MDDWENYAWFENGADGGNIGADFEQMPQYDFSSYVDSEFGNTAGGIDSLLGSIKDNLESDDWKNYGFFESGDENTQAALDRLEALKGDNIDVGGGYNPATGRGDEATADAVRQTGVTGSAYVPHTTTPSGLNPGGGTITPGGTDKKTDVTNKGGTNTQGGNQQQQSSGMNPLSLMLLMYALSQMNKGGGSTQTTIPKLSGSRSQLPYSPPSRPGAGGVTYFSPMKYMAGGGIATLGNYSDGGQLLKGPGDGVSDSIPATIGGHQPARLADGEFVVPARIVSELGNGSTEAGARKLYAMMKRIEKTRKGAKDIAANTKADRHLPA